MSFPSDPEAFEYASAPPMNSATQQFPGKKLIELASGNNMSPSMEYRGISGETNVILLQPVHVAPLFGEVSQDPPAEQVKTAVPVDDGVESVAVASVFASVKGKVALQLALLTVQFTVWLGQLGGGAGHVQYVPFPSQPDWHARDSNAEPRLTVPLQSALA
jgi:hypothetical protein